MNLSNMPTPTNKIKEETGIDIKKFKKYITKYWGKRCKDYCWGCHVCAIWRVYDDIKEIVEFEKDFNRLIKH